MDRLAPRSDLHSRTISGKPLMLFFFTGSRYGTDQWEVRLQLVIRQAFAVPESKPNESLYQCRPRPDFKRRRWTVLKRCARSSGLRSRSGRCSA